MVMTREMKDAWRVLALRLASRGASLNLLGRRSHYLK